MSDSYDSLYHRLFSHPGVVAQLLREFVRGPWLDGLDLNALERLNTTFHADTGEKRLSDVIWRIPSQGGQDSYVVLLLEFQSTIDRYMALRVMVYAGLLLQHLLKERRIEPNGRLPPLLPVVLYNGDTRWEVPEHLGKLIALPQNSPLWPWQPAMSYYLIDSGGFGEADLAKREGLPALWFRLENASGPDQMATVIKDVQAWLVRHPEFDTLRGLFAQLLGKIVVAPGRDPRQQPTF